MTLSFKDVSEILKIIDASNCEELVLELEGIKLAVRRRSAEAGTETVTAPGTLRSSFSEPEIEADSRPIHAPANASPAPPATAGSQVRAPMVGTFYRRPAPDKPPFVETGSIVGAGDPLCLIEVMKLYTTIEAAGAGTVKLIAVEDGQLVEFDQLLFVIEPG